MAISIKLKYVIGGRSTFFGFGERKRIRALDLEVVEEEALDLVRAADVEGLVFAFVEVCIGVADGLHHLFFDA